MFSIIGNTDHHFHETLGLYYPIISDSQIRDYCATDITKYYPKQVNIYWDGISLCILDNSVSQDGNDNEVDSFANTNGFYQDNWRKI